MRSRLVAAAVLFSWLLLAPLSQAQFLPQSPSSKQEGAAPEAGKAQPSSANPEQQNNAPAQAQPEQNSGEFKQRLLYIIPDFWAQNLDANIPPLTKKQKFVLFVRTTTDRSTLLGAAFSAGISQATDSPSRYDQNLRGYSQRFGLVMAGTTVSNGLKLAALPILFRQDPRYFRLNRGSGMKRTMYAFSRVAVARSDRGDFMVNWSELLGSFGAAAVANSWHEERDRTFADTMSRGALSIGFDAGFNLLKEFWPELKRRLGTGRKPAGQNGSPAQQTLAPAPGKNVSGR